MGRRRRPDSQHLEDAREHLRVPDDWPKIVGMRTMLAHQYADLDQEILQNTIDNRLAWFVRLVDRLHQAAIANEGG
jgi:uncharacterized protein with HEPN domain